MEVDWSELPHHILVEIAGRLPLFEEYLAFGTVCHSWRLAAARKNFRFKSSQVPLLMLAPTIENINSRGFFNLSNGKIHQLRLTKAIGKRCYSSKGWLMTVGRDMGVNLLHPFTGVEIKLPNLKTFRIRDWKYQSPIMKHAHYIEKFVLSSDPSTTPDYTVMVIHGSTHKLGYCKSGDKVWTVIETANTGCLADVIYYMDSFYAINYGAGITVFKGDNLTEETQVIKMPGHLTEDLIEQIYIVESNGEIFVVFRDGSHYNQTYNFDVFKLDFATQAVTKVEDLGNRAFFLGHNSSVSIEASVSWKCKPSHIYFTDDYWVSYWRIPEGGGKDMGIFNLKDRTIQPHFEGRSYNRINPPMWVEWII